MKEQNMRSAFLGRLVSIQRHTRRGQTLVEYAMILAFISIVSVVVLRSLGTSIFSIYSYTTSGLNAVNSAGS